MIHNHEVGGSIPPHATNYKLRGLSTSLGGKAFFISLPMFYFYVLYSLKDNRLYKGSTTDLPKRILQHNAGRTPSTKYRRPLILLYFEPYSDKAQAYQREAWTKTLEGGAELKALLINKKLLNQNGCLNLIDKK